MATFNTVWSVDLGKASLKAVKLRREKNNIEILAVDKIDYSLSTNGADPLQQAREALNAFRIRNEVREPVVVAHPGQGTFSRFIKVPAFEAKKLREMVGYEASQQIPFPLDEVIWDYHLVSREYLPGEEREVGIFAVRREAIDDYLLDFTNEGLSVEVLSIGYLGLLNYIFFDLAPEEPSIVVDIGATHTDLILVDGKKFWIRALPHSGNDINKSIMERFKLSFPEAEKLKIESAKAPQQAVKIFSNVIQPKLKELVGEIHRSTGYYRSQAGDVQFKKLYLLGNGSKIFGIKKYLAEQLGVEVERVQSIRHFRVNRGVDLKLLQNELPAFGTAFGCGLQGLGAGSCRVDLVPQEERIQKDFRRKKKHAFIAMGVVLAAILVAGFFLNGKIQESAGVAKEHSDWITKEIIPHLPKGPGVDFAEFGRQEKELKQLAEVRGLVLKALSSLGAVVPKENDLPDTSIEVEEKKKDAVEGELKIKLAELNKKKLFIPWMKVDRIDWPEQAAEAARAQKDSKKKAPPTVPAYKVTVLGAVVGQATNEESLALLRKLLVDPLKKKMKDLAKVIPDLKDADVNESSEYITLPRLVFQESKTGGGTQPGGRRTAGQTFDEGPQDAGPFFGTQITWTLRIADPKEEVVETKKVDEEEEEGGKKIGSGRKTGKKPK